jgi:hypothetical protein
MYFVRETFLDQPNSNIGSNSSMITTDFESNLIGVKDNNSSYDSKDHICIYETPRDLTRFMNN